MSDQTTKVIRSTGSINDDSMDEEPLAPTDAEILALAERSFPATPKVKKVIVKRAKTIRALTDAEENAVKADILTKNYETIFNAKQVKGASDVIKASVLTLATVDPHKIIYERTSIAIMRDIIAVHADTMRASLHENGVLPHGTSIAILVNKEEFEAAMESHKVEIVTSVTQLHPDITTVLNSLDGATKVIAGCHRLEGSDGLIGTWIMDLAELMKLKASGTLSIARLEQVEETIQKIKDSLAALQAYPVVVYDSAQVSASKLATQWLAMNVTLPHHEGTLVDKLQHAISAATPSQVKLELGGDQKGCAIVQDPQCHRFLESLFQWPIWREKFTQEFYYDLVVSQHGYAWFEAALSTLELLEHLFSGLVEDELPKGMKPDAVDVHFNLLTTDVELQLTLMYKEHLQELLRGGGVDLTSFEAIVIFEKYLTALGSSIQASLEAEVGLSPHEVVVVSLISKRAATLFEGEWFVPGWCPRFGLDLSIMVKMAETGAIALSEHFVPDWYGMNYIAQGRNKAPGKYSPMECMTRGIIEPMFKEETDPIEYGKHLLRLLSNGLPHLSAALRRNNLDTHYNLSSRPHEPVTLLPIDSNYKILLTGAYITAFNNLLELDVDLDDETWQPDLEAIAAKATRGSQEEKELAKKAKGVIAKQKALHVRYDAAPEDLCRVDLILLKKQWQKSLLQHIPKISPTHTTSFIAGILQGWTRERYAIKMALIPEFRTCVELLKDIPEEHVDADYILKTGCFDSLVDDPNLDRHHQWAEEKRMVIPDELEEEELCWFWKHFNVADPTVDPFSEFSPTDQPGAKNYEEEETLAAKYGGKGKPRGRKPTAQTPAASVAPSRQTTPQDSPIQEDAPLPTVPQDQPSSEVVPFWRQNQITRQLELDEAEKLRRAAAAANVLQDALASEEEAQDRRVQPPGVAPAWSGLDLSQAPASLSAVVLQGDYRLTQPVQVSGSTNGSADLSPSPEIILAGGAHSKAARQITAFDWKSLSQTQQQPAHFGHDIGHYLAKDKWNVTDIVIPGDMTDVHFHIQEPGWQQPPGPVKFPLDQYLSKILCLKTVTFKYLQDCQPLSYDGKAMLSHTPITISSVEALVHFFWSIAHLPPKNRLQNLSNQVKATVLIWLDLNSSNGLLPSSHESEHLDIAGICDPVWLLSMCHPSQKKQWVRYFETGETSQGKALYILKIDSTKNLFLSEVEEFLEKPVQTAPPIKGLKIRRIELDERFKWCITAAWALLLETYREPEPIFKDMTPFRILMIHLSSVLAVAFGDGCAATYLNWGKKEAKAAVDTTNQTSGKRSREDGSPRKGDKSKVARSEAIPMEEVAQTEIEETEMEVEVAPIAIELGPGKGADADPQVDTDSEADSMDLEE